MANSVDSDQTGPSQYNCISQGEPLKRAYEKIRKFDFDSGDLFPD